MFRTWWRGGVRRKAKTIRRKRRGDKARFRPGVELLEDRRLLAAGALDPTFGTGGQVVADFGREVYAGGGTALLPDGKIVVAATVQSNPFFGKIAGASNLDFLLARYHPDGSLDDSFGTGGWVVHNFGGQESAHDMALQPDGKIVVVGSRGPFQDFLPGSDFLVARFHDDGSLDTTFGQGGRVITDFGTGVGPFDSTYDVAAGVALQADGAIVVAGSTSPTDFSSGRFALARYTPHGRLDDSFGSGGQVIDPTAFFGPANHAAGVALQPDGQIVVVGTSSPSISSGPSSPSSAIVLTRYNPDGSPDATFGTEGAVIDTFSEYGASGASGAALAIQADGQIVVAGPAWIATPSPFVPGATIPGSDFALARFNADGTPDTTFGTEGRVATDFGSGSDEAQAVALQADGKIVVVGVSQTFGTFPSGASFAVARYNADGSLDGSFGEGGLVTTDFGGYDDARAVAIQSDGGIVVTGGTRADNGFNSTLVLARYLGDPAPETGTLTGRVFRHVCPPGPGPVGETTAAAAAPIDVGPIEIGPIGLDLQGAGGVTIWLGGDLVTVTAADGTFSFPDLPVGTYTVYAFVGGYAEASAMVTVTPGGTASVSLVLPFASPGTLLVSFRPGTTSEQVAAVAESYGITSFYRPAPILLPNLYVFRLPLGAITQDFIIALRQEPLVQSVGRDEILCLH